MRDGTARRMSAVGRCGRCVRQQVGEPDPAQENQNIGLERRLKQIYPDYRVPGSEIRRYRRQGRVALPPAHGFENIRSRDQRSRSRQAVTAPVDCRSAIEPTAPPWMTANGPLGRARLLLRGDQ